jgi:hypothetical protein
MYGVIENYCLRVAKFFENGLGRDSWHKELLRRMTMEIETVRPALLDQATYQLVDELRSFRHLRTNSKRSPVPWSRRTDQEPRGGGGAEPVGRRDASAHAPVRSSRDI